MIDIYCERTAHGLWAEPVNAVTNLAFIVAALALFRLAPAAEGEKLSLRILSAQAALVGVSSLSFHTFATRFTGALDALSIALFALTYIYLYTRRIFSLNRAVSTALTIACPFVCFAVSRLISLIDSPFTSSGFYIGLLAQMLLLALFTLPKKPRVTLIKASLLFSASITARALDMPVCEKVPVGTHFLWHIFNGVVIFLLGRAYVEGTNRAE